MAGSEFYSHEICRVSDLTQYASNSRTHGDWQIKQIAASIREWGFTSPVLIDEEKTVIAGHGRLMAAESLEMAEVPCIVLAGLTEGQKKAYVIADNKLALNSGWDDAMLAAEMQSLSEIGFNTDLVGFSDEEVRSMFPEFEPAGEGDQGGLDSIAEQIVCCPSCGEAFDARQAQA